MKAQVQTTEIIQAYQRPLAFYTLATMIPWGLWFISGHISHLSPYSHEMKWITSILSFTGLLAPVLIAFWFILPNKTLREDFMRRFFNFKTLKPQYLLITVFLMLVSILAAQAISLLFGYPADQFQLRGSFSFSSGIFPVWVLLLLAPLLEELAWHSYGTDCLRSRFNLFTASVLFAFFWSLWHFPLSFIKDYYHSNLVESGLIYSVNFVVSLVPFVLIMNWLYYKTNRNMLLPIVFHISAGFFNEIFSTHPMSKVIQTGLLLVLSAFLVLTNRSLFFNRIFNPSTIN
ncbi:CPBP family glutamic-type intramembrane protease [uncultured Sunxiuqinia sp.]|uniref:CPBP family glutamic-type intramembrane protease n=1 Tax=uncultured Sunxiuqinia sp. TaxID=1573825 RepID=UPI0030DAE843|tara:strand:+ start:94558 stop:95421 length:864 start_codon:yes stop_codon:yes gene_type:complete